MQSDFPLFSHRAATLFTLHTINVCRTIWEPKIWAEASAAMLHGCLFLFFFCNLTAFDSSAPALSPSLFTAADSPLSDDKFSGFLAPSIPFDLLPNKKTKKKKKIFTSDGFKFEEFIYRFVSILSSCCFGDRLRWIWFENKQQPETLRSGWDGENRELSWYLLMFSFHSILKIVFLFTFKTIQLVYSR